MDKKTLKECLDKINQMKVDHVETLRNLTEAESALEEASSQGDDIDQSSNISEMNRLKSLKAQAEIKTKQLAAAQQRINSGNFGVCLTCEDDIPKNRLLANPLSIRCISCQEDLEVVQKENKLRSKRAPSSSEAEAFSDED